MNFLNSIILYGLGAAILPLVIHLLSRRRARDVKFPSIRLLEHMKSERIRRLKIKQLIVLLLRTLIILLIILAFARPALRSMFRSNARTAAVIILDSSASMQYIHDGERLSENAVRKAAEIIDMLGNDDTAAVVVSTNPPFLLSPGMTAEKNDIQKALDTFEPSFSGSGQTEAFTQAVSLLNTSNIPNRELYYITDGAVNSLPDSLGQTHESIRLYQVNVGADKRESPVLFDVELREHFVAVGNEVTFNVSGYEESGNDVSVELYVNGDRKGRIPGEYQSGNIFEAQFSFTPEEPGWYSVSAVVEGGRSEQAETRRLVLHVPQKVAVLVVGGTTDDVYFLQKALAPDAENSMFNVRTIVVDNLTSDDINLADVIVLSGVSALSGAHYSSMRNAVLQRGIGLIVFPPHELDAALYSNGIFRDIIPLNILKSNISDNVNSQGFALIEQFNLNHPVLKGISKEGNFRKPEIISYHTFIPVSQTSIIARFNDGSPAICESLSGNGHAVVFSVDATLSSGDFPVTGLFVPLFLRTLQYVSDTFVMGEKLIVGDRIRPRMRDIQPGTVLAIKPENEAARSVLVTFTGNGAEIKDETAHMPGFFSIMAGTEELQRYSIDIPAYEATFQRAGNKMLTDAYKGIRWKALGAGENLADFVMSDRYGTELFSLFLIMALAVLALEMVLSRKL